MIGKFGQMSKKKIEKNLFQLIITIFLSCREAILPILPILSRPLSLLAYPVGIQFNHRLVEELCG
jgi:hypothetical protein